MGWKELKKGNTTQNVGSKVDVSNEGDTHDQMAEEEEKKTISAWSYSVGDVFLLTTGILALRAVYICFLINIACNNIMLVAEATTTE